MASAVGMMGGCGSPSSGSCWLQLKGPFRKNCKTTKKNDGFRVCCVSSSAVTDPYKTLRIQPGASESDVKKAFRSLALQYHPDVCRGSDCGIQFHQINEAYDIVMSNLRGEESRISEMEVYEESERIDESFRGMEDPDWELWEEWMGWEGAGIRDYSSHINPYI